jgi:iron complex transport system ATP-binding protein
MHLLRRLARTTDRTFLLSTHDLDLALRSADRIWLLPPGGPLRVGAPENLVLSGAFERTFRGEGVNFDTSTGSFTIPHEHLGQVALKAEGAPAFWATRALEREGFDVLPDDSACPLRLETEYRGDDLVWTLTVDGQTCRLSSLSEVVARLGRQQES